MQSWSDDARRQGNSPRIDEAFAFVERVMERPERYPDKAILFLMNPSEIASVVTKERLRILRDLSDRGYPSSSTSPAASTGM